MSPRPQAPLRTGLRGLYERLRRLPPEGQLQECIDQLGHPELLVEEFLNAYFEVEAHTEWVPRSLEPAAEEDEGELVLEFFYRGREIEVVGRESDSFVCVSGGIDTVPSEGERLGLDYAALPRKPERRPSLGVVQSLEDGTPYLVYLRLLACFAELAPSAQILRLDETIFDGCLGSQPVFDLHAVMWAGEPTDATRSLHELTRDLAELVKEAAREDPMFPDVLGGVSAYTMDPDRFDGRVDFAWSV